MMTRRTVLFITTNLSGIILLGLAIFLLLHFRAGATSLPATSSSTPTALAPTQLMVSVVEDGVPAQGLLGVSGNCGGVQLTGENGVFNCSLSTVSSDYKGYTLQGLTFQSSKSGRLYMLPILPAGKTGTLVMKSGVIISLKVTITAGVVQMVESDGSQYHEVDVTKGLQEQRAE